ncbi:hypothetical protein J5N97_000581 [Dioscorea zingiberensis]|uniref:Uncharacterized protein n=1 Tax=Dioscorea zingiberensis TaxID=325984 RepID=A0A9D5BSC4_9LILI|nr:hypothetical protein J5N97_000581 [Dioscorea zingiberensis]
MATSPGTSWKRLAFSPTSLLFHINSNRFCGIIPHKFERLKLLFELDLSNNRFAGRFPDVVLRLPSLKFLDLRYNEFEGTVPKELFDKDLDAIFINDNRFVFDIPDNFGNSPVSVIVLANTRFHGCVPSSIGKYVEAQRDSSLEQWVEVLHPGGDRPAEEPSPSST